MSDSMQVWVVVTDMGLNGHWIRGVYDHDPELTNDQFAAYQFREDHPSTIGYNNGTEVVQMTLQTREDRAADETFMQRAAMMRKAMRRNAG